MFFAIPLENKPTWRNPPWMTVLIILLNMVVFWGPQRSEENALGRATAFYIEAELPELEFPAFIKHLQSTRPKEAQAAQAALEQEQFDLVLELMEREEQFVHRLRQQLVITPAHPHFDRWRQARDRYEAMRPAAFTARWSKDYRASWHDHPETWLTAAFLHADTSHLLGNMVFLFLFGFTVELSLGRRWYGCFYLFSALGASALSAWVYQGQLGYGLGASGAISGLMSMYAVLYRFQKINFFYSLLFYFNVVRAPAIVLLPLWIANELGQHFWSDNHVAYMAHLGGLITGAVLMASFRTTRNARVATEPTTPQASFQQQVDKAHDLAAAMKLEASCQAWGQAVRLQPDNLMALEKYFNTAALWPAKDHFHRAAAAVFRLKSTDTQAMAFQHQAFQTYFNKAKPHARLRPHEMAQLCQRFARAGFTEDAGKLCRALLSSDPNHADAVDLMSQCAQAHLRVQQTDEALGWLPSLEQRAPKHPTTLRLRELSG